MEIKEAKLEDAGEYTVTVTNDGGSTCKVAKVTVDKKIPKAKPKMSKMPKAVTATEGETIRLNCKVTGKGHLVCEYMNLLQSEKDRSTAIQLLDEATSY